MSTEYEELIAEARQYADAEMELHEQSAVVGQKLEDIHASNAELFAQLADALEAASAETPEAKTVRQLHEFCATIGMSIESALAAADVHRRLTAAETKLAELLATKPVTVNTPAELDALAVGSVVLDAELDTYVKGSRGDRWYLPGNLTDWPAGSIAFPAIVLHAPGEGGK